MGVGNAQSQQFDYNHTVLRFIFYLCGCMHVAMGTHADQKRIMDFLELELQVFMSDLTCVLELNAALWKSSRHYCSY